MPGVVSRGTALRLVRLAFWLALVVTLVAAFLPGGAAAHVMIMPWDKAEHFLAFYLLTLLAMVLAIGLVVDDARSSGP